MPSKRKTQRSGTDSSPPVVKQSHKKPQSQPLDAKSSDIEEPINYDPYFSGSVVRCGAKKRDGSKCRNLSMENGRCRIHGGKAVPAPEGNKRAVTHGAYESILMSLFTDEEVDMWDNSKNDIMENLDVTLKIMTIRETRMLRRIQVLTDAGDFTMTEVTREKGDTDKGYRDITTKKKTGTLSQIQAIESELTKLQEKKARLLELKHKIENASGKGDVPNFDKYYAALEKTAAEVWGDEDEK